MLERTASSLEQCALHRILATSSRSAYSVRKLSPTFWRHGAAALETSVAWAALLRTRARALTGPTRVRRTVNPSSNGYDALEALYSSGALSTIRRASASFVDVHDRWLYSPPFIQTRSITSSAPHRFLDIPQPLVSHAPDNAHFNSARIPDASPILSFSQIEPPSARLEGEKGQKGEIASSSATDYPTDDHHRALALEHLRHLISEVDKKQTHEVWELYSHLPSSSQDEVRAEVLLYTGRWAISKIEAARCWSLVTQLDPDSLDGDLALIAVRSCLKLGLHKEALDYFKTSLTRHPSKTIFKEIIFMSFKTSSETLLWDAWQLWSVHHRSKSALPSLQRLRFLPLLGKTVLDFSAHLDAQRKALSPNNLKKGAPEDLSAGKGRGASPARKRTGGTRTKRLGETAQVDDIISISLESKPIEKSVAQTQQTKLIDNLDRLLRDVAEMALFQPCKPSYARGLLRLLDRPELYAEYIIDAFQRRETTHLPVIFQAYKRHPRTTMDPRVLGVMFEIFYPYDRRRLLGLHKEFCRVYYGDGNLPSEDTTAIRNWWSSYGVRGALFNQTQDPLSYEPYIEVFRIHSDEEMAQFALNDVAERLGVQLGDLEWHRRLKQYCLTGDYRGAMNDWTSRNGEVRPDIHTLATIMALSADSGDTNFTLEMFEKAKKWRLHRTPRILVSVIQALGNNGLLKQATKLCTWAMENGIRSPELFNTMLAIFASHHRLHESHRLMNSMAQHGIPWDEQTFLQLTKALARCKQVDKAYELLRQALQLQFWRVTTKHFEAVMAGALKTGQYNLVHSLGKRMEEEGLPMSLNAMTLLAKSAHRWAIAAKENPNMPPLPDALPTGRDLVEYYRKSVATPRRKTSQAAGEQPAEINGNSSSSANFDPDKPGSTLALKRIAYALAKMGDEGLIAEVTSIYQQCESGQCSERDLPDGMLTAMMITASERGQNRRVKHLWSILWERNLQLSLTTTDEAKETARSPRPKIPVKLQYNLDEGFKTMQEVLTQERDADGLLELLRKVTSAGFHLGRRNWNHTIQALAGMGRVKEAFTYCEQMLMPNWMGWRHIRKLKIHRIRRNMSEIHIRKSQQVQQAQQAQDQQSAATSTQARTPPPPTAQTTAGGLLPRRDDLFAAPREEARLWYTTTTTTTTTTNPKPQRRSTAATPLPSDEAERQYVADHAKVALFLRQKYNDRRARRWQRQRKARGKSVTLAPQLLNPGLNPRYLRPNADTLRLLARIYLDLQRGDAWSAQASETYRFVRSSCPRTAYAINTLRYSDDEEVGAWFGEKYAFGDEADGVGVEEGNVGGGDEGKMGGARRRRKKMAVTPKLQGEIKNVLALSKVVRAKRKRESRGGRGEGEVCV